MIQYSNIPDVLFFPSKRTFYLSLYIILFLKYSEHCQLPERRDELYEEYLIYQSPPEIPSDIISHLRAKGDIKDNDESQI